MSLFLPSQLSPNFEEVIEGNDLEFRFLVNTNGSEITSYKLEILNENNDAETPDENILYTQRGDFTSPLSNQDEGLITVFYSDIKNILIPGHNYRWRVRLYDAQVFNNSEPPMPNVSVDNIQSEALTYRGSGNLVGTTRNVIWLDTPVENIQEEDFVEMYLQSNDFSNDFKPFINDNQTYTKEATDGLSIIDDGKYCWIPAGVSDINELILPNYQDKLCDGNMYFQIAENLIEGSPVYLDTDCMLYHGTFYITILNSKNFKASNETVYQFGMQVNPDDWPKLDEWDNMIPKTAHFIFSYPIIDEDGNPVKNEQGNPVREEFSAQPEHDIPIAQDKMLQLYLSYNTQPQQSRISDMPFNNQITNLDVEVDATAPPETIFTLYTVTVHNVNSLSSGTYAFRCAFQYGLPGLAQIWFQTDTTPVESLGKIIIAKSDNTLADAKDIRVWYFTINNTNANTKDVSLFFPSPVYPYIPRQILTSRVIIDNQNKRHFYFGISQKQSLSQWMPVSSAESSKGQEYTYKLVYLERQEVFGITAGVGTNSLTKIETDKPFTYNVSHGERVSAPLVNNHFYANKLYIQPIDEFDSKDVGNVYLIYSNTLDGLALTHSYSYQEYASFIQYSQQEMENMGAKKIINYVADTGEITLFSNLDDVPDLFSLYQIFTIDKTLSDYAINPKYKILNGSLVYIKNGVRYLEDKPHFSSLSFKSAPHYLGGKAVYNLRDALRRLPVYIYNEGFNETDKIIDGTYLRGDSSIHIYSNHFDNVSRWQETDDLPQMLTYKMFVQPNNALKEDYYAPCVLNLHKTFNDSTENIYGYVTNSFVKSEYNKYLSIDHLDESQYLITYTIYSSTLNGSKYQIQNIVTLPQSGNNYYDYYITLNIDNNLEVNDTCVVCLQYGISGNDNLGDNIWFMKKNGTLIGRALLPTQNKSSYAPGLYQIKITDVDGDGKDTLYHIELSNTWTYPEIKYNTQDLNKMIFPQTPYKIYSYFVDSIPEQFFYYRVPREIELEFSEAFTGASDVMRPGDILWEGAYNFEAIPVNMRAKDIKEIDETIVGGTVAWNQLYNRKDTVSTNGITFTNNNGKVTISGVATNTAYYSYPIEMIAGHKYLLSGCPIGSSSTTFDIAIWGQATVKLLDNKQATVFANSSGTGVNIDVRTGYDANAKPVTFIPQLYDLTQMFGSAIADYIYSIEQSNEGAGVAFFKKFFPNPYYAYNAGTLMSVKAAAHNTVGFNAWDEEWEIGAIDPLTGENYDSITNCIRSTNYIRIVPNVTYYFKGNFANGAFFYDANKNYLSVMYPDNDVRQVPANAHYCRFALSSSYGTTYNHDICINLSWGGERDGEYEAYVKHEYALDYSLELRGIPKLDKNNNLYYDGDTYESDGTVTRKYSIVDMGTLNWGIFNSELHLFYAKPAGIAVPVTTADRLKGFICSKYPADTVEAIGTQMTDKTCKRNNSSSFPFIVRDSSYSDAAAFKTAMSGVYLVYELETPTTETARPYTNPQNIEPYGTAQFVDYANIIEDRDVSIPVGHMTRNTTKKLIVRDAKVQAKISSRSDNAFAVPNIKYYRYFLYATVDDKEKKLIYDSGIMYDNQLCSSFYGLESIYSMSVSETDPPVKINGKTKYEVDFLCEDEYGHILKKSCLFYPQYVAKWLDSTAPKINSGINCTKQTADLTIHLSSNDKSWKLYKKKYNDFYGTYLNTYDLNPQITIEDFLIKNGEAYQYSFWKMDTYDTLQQCYIYNVYNTLGAVRACWSSWSLCDLVYDYKNKSYIPSDTIFLFGKNINAGSLTKNISRISYETLSQYNRILSGASKYDSGNLTCLFGDFKVAQKISNNFPIVTIYGVVPKINLKSKQESFLEIINSHDISIAEYFFRQNGLLSGMDNIFLKDEYKETILYVEDLGLYYGRRNTPRWEPLKSSYRFVSDVEKISCLQNCLANKQKKLLKAPNGNAWIVAITGDLTREIDWKSGQYPTNISFNWQEVEDISKAKVLNAYISEGDVYDYMDLSGNVIIWKAPYIVNESGEIIIL